MWKLSAVKAGSYTVLFKVGEGSGARTRTAGGVAPGGSFHVNITDVPPDTRVTDSGKVVTIPSRAGERWQVAFSRMGRRAVSCAAVSLAAMAMLPACGGAQPNQGQAVAAHAGASAAGRLALKRIGRFEAPVYVTGAPGFPRLLFVVEQPGRVAVLKNGRRLPRPFLDISGLVSYEGERGLLSIAFPPDYASSRRFYVYYTDRGGTIQIDEFKRGPPPGRGWARAAR